MKITFIIKSVDRNITEHWMYRL